MAKFGDFDDAEFQNMAKKFDEAVKKDLPKKIIQDSLNQAVQLVMAQVKERTPVDTGALRRGWSASGIKNGGSSYHVDISNARHYAPYIEFGHRLRNGGYYPGVFMLTNTLNDIDSAFQRIVENNFKKYMKGLGVD